MNAYILIENYRSIGRASFYVRPGLNVMVGPNGSGKTNTLHALKLLSNVLTNGAALAMGKAGGPARNFRRGAENIRFVILVPHVVTLYKGRQTQFSLSWQIELSLNSENNLTYISYEAIRISAIFDKGPEDVISIWVNRRGSGIRTRFQVADSELLTKKLVEYSDWVSSGSTKKQMFEQLKESIQEQLAECKEASNDVSILGRFSRLGPSARSLYRDVYALDEYSIQPDVARQASDPLPVVRMGNDGGGLSEVIGALEAGQFRRFFDTWGYLGGGNYSGRGGGFLDYQMLRSMERKNPLDDISDNLRQAVVAIDSVSSDIDRSTGRRYAIFKSGENVFRPEEVSDGTIKWLCLLVALYVPRSRVVLLEEPENFMHPWMQQKFVALIRKQTSTNSMSVFMSTHSVTVLNALALDELLLVRQVDQGTVIESAANDADIGRVLQETNFGLGDIWVSGGIGEASGGVQ